nr:AMP-binding protein [Devosia ginsengisoli]
MSSPLAALAGTPSTIAEALARATALAGAEEYLVCGSARARFGEMQQLARHWGRALHRAGVRPGDHVGLCLGNGLDWVAAFFAIGLLGAVAVPVNTRLKPTEIEFILRQSRISTLLVADRFLKIDFIAMLRGLLPAIDTVLPGPELPDLRTMIVLGNDIPAAALGADALLRDSANDAAIVEIGNPDDPLLIQYTSGTTAFPKGAVLTQRAMLWNAYTAGLMFGLRAGASYLSARPFFHISGSTLSILAALQHAAKLVTMERFDAGEALALAEVECCTLFSGNDTLWMMLLNHEDVDQRQLRLRGGGARCRLRSMNGSPHASALQSSPWPMACRKPPTSPCRPGGIVRMTRWPA